MPRYFYIARDKEGKKRSGIEEASTQEEATRKLQSQSLIVINIFPETKEHLSDIESICLKTTIRPRHYRITSTDIVLFCRQLATLLGAGVTILQSLNIISKQVTSKRLYNVILDLVKRMESGFSFHDAMSKHSDVFSDLWVNLVESGEASGSLAMVLNRLAGYLERNAAFKRKVVTAAIYPILLTFVGFVALIFMTLGIIPKFVELFKSFDVELPALTRALVGFSIFLRKYGLVILGIAGAGIFAFRWYIKTSAGRRRYERFLFQIPVIGDFFRILIYERFTSEMSTLIESGVPILYSLEITERSVSNLTAGSIINKIREEVRDGKPLNQPMEKSGFFDPMAVQMVAVGEEIGELSIMFKRLNSFYQEYIDTFLERLTALFEPIMLITLAILIGIMIVGLFMPIFQVARLAG